MYKLSTIFFLSLLVAGCCNEKVCDCSNNNDTDRSIANEICNISGRGKYLVAEFDSIKHCTSAIVREHRGSNHLCSYKLEHFKEDRWVLFFHGEQNDIGRVVYFNPIDTKKIRIHFVRAVKMPDIEQFSIYSTLQE